MTTTPGASRRVPVHRRIRDAWLPDGRAGRIFVLVALIDSLGTGLYLAGSALYLNRAVGLSAGQVGLGLGAGALTGLVATVPSGMVADRLGAKRTLIALQLWRGIWFVAFALVTSFWQFVAVSILLGLADRAVGPLTQAVVGTAVEGASRVKVLALMRSVRNVGFGLGAALSTGLIAFDTAVVYRGMMLADALSFFLAMAALRLVRLDAVVPVRRKRVFGGPRALADRPYLVLALLNGVMTVHMALLSVGLPLWLTRHTSAPPSLVGIMMMLNTGMAALLQVWASRGCEDTRVAARRMRAGSLVLAACAALLPLAHGRTPLVAGGVLLFATVLLTLAELWQSGGAWGLSIELAPAEYRAEYLSVFSLGRSVQEIAGPVVVTSLILTYPIPGWLSLAACLVAAGLAVPAVERWATVGRGLAVE